MSTPTPHAPHPTPAFVPVATLADLPPGALLAVRHVDGTPICLFNHDGQIGAVLDCCTHNDFRMSEGFLHADGTIECAWHGGRFDCATGAARRAPAFDPLPVYEVRVEGEQVLVGPRKVMR
ncbi:MAG TPA: non-heme iron oxygenase ferredoxin subunit [Gemmatimonadaceae bacterium]|nr:non-heme iron oxygenase ferredoxin subunit [Gemmatimonadaceae bacterium]